MTSTYKRTIGYEAEAEWRAAEAATKAARRDRQGEAAERAFRRSPRYASMLDETRRSGMRYDRDAAVEALADQWLAAAAAGDDAASGREARPADETETLAAMWDAAVDAGSMAYRYPDTIRHAAYGGADRIADAWTALAVTVDAMPYGGTPDAGDALASGLSILDPGNHARRTRWARERMRPGIPFASTWTVNDAGAPVLAWDVTPCRVYTADGTLLREIVARVSRRGRVNEGGARDGAGRKAVHATNADRQRAYRERKADERSAARAAARAAAVVDSTPTD